MPLVQSDVGIETALDGLIDNLGANCQLCLFLTNITPAKTDVAATYTAHEAGFTGYSRITLTTWGAIVVAAHVAKSVELVRTFTRTGGSTDVVYGYFVLDVANNLLWAEAFPGGPITMSEVGQTLAIQPAVTHESKYP